MANVLEQVSILGALLQEEDDVEQAELIKAQYDKASAAAQEIIAGNIAAHTAEYEAATAALQESIEALKAAKARGEALAERISKVALVVDKLAELASKVA